MSEPTRSSGGTAARWRSELPKEELLKLMGGGAELDKLSHELEEYAAVVEQQGPDGSGASAAAS